MWLAFGKIRSQLEYGFTIMTCSESPGVMRNPEYTCQKGILWVDLYEPLHIISENHFRTRLTTPSSQPRLSAQDSDLRVGVDERDVTIRRGCILSVYYQEGDLFGATNVMVQAFFSQTVRSGSIIHNDITQTTRSTEKCMRKVK